MSVLICSRVMVLVGLGWDFGDPSGDDSGVGACVQGGAVAGEFGVALGEPGVGRAPAAGDRDRDVRPIGPADGL